jgi:general secretion pathway protein K
MAHQVNSGPVQPVGIAQQGIALVMVLWVLALLTIMAMAMVAVIRSEQGLVMNRLDQARIRAVADAAVAYAYLRVTNGPEEERWIPDGSPNTWNFAGMDLTIQVHDESSRIDLNKASDVLLTDLLEVAGVNRREAEHLAHNLIAWRDPSDSKITGGAQARDYRAAGLAYGAKNANFDSVEELRQVMGFSLEQYRILAPNLTVHGASASPRDLTLAPPLARAALELKMAPMAASTLRTHNMGGPFYRIQVHGLEDTGPAMEILIKTGASLGRPYGTIALRMQWQSG